MLILAAALTVAEEEETITAHRGKSTGHSTPEGSVADFDDRPPPG